MNETKKDILEQPVDRLYGIGESVEELSRRATLADMKLIPVKLRHIGTERSRQVLQAMRDFIQRNVELKLEEAATRIVVEGGDLKGIETS